MAFPPPDEPRQRQPAFNLPGVVIVVLGVLVGIHIISAIAIDARQYEWLILNFAFFPERPTDVFPPVDIMAGADVWSFLTYGLLHADWGHLVVNGIWMAAFGSPLAWRFGPARFLAFSAVAVVAGALVHLVAHGGETVALVGASAAVSAHLAGAARFLFIGPAILPRSFRRPAASLAEIFTDARTLTFLGVWVVINLAVGLFGVFGGEGNRIAWEAHLGGFAVGLFLFPLFDPVPRGGDIGGRPD